MTHIASVASVAYLAEVNTDQDPDVVAYTLQCVLKMSPAFGAALAQQVEEQVKAEFGGRRLYLPKGKKRLTPAEREAVFKDGMTQMPTDEIIEKHKVGRASLFRIMKQGSRFSAV